MSKKKGRDTVGWTDEMIEDFYRRIIKDGTSTNETIMHALDVISKLNPGTTSGSKKM